MIDSTWISCEIIRGNVEHSLTQFINEQKIDFVIVRNTLFKKFDLEKNEIFKRLFLNVSELPILIIPNNYSFESFEKFTISANKIETSS